MASVAIPKGKAPQKKKGVMQMYLSVDAIEPIAMLCVQQSGCF